MTAASIGLGGHRIRLLLVVLVLALVRGLIYAAIIPPWQAPDEPRHFEYVRLLDQKRRLVGWSDLDPALEREIIASMHRFDYWRFGFSDASVKPPEANPQRFWDVWVTEGTSHILHQPPLAYLFYVAALQYTRGASPSTQLYAMRLLSVLLAVLISAVAFWTLDALFPQNDILLTATLTFVVFLPMHTYMTSMLNNDHLAELLVSLAILLWVLIFRSGLTWGRLLLLVVLIVGSALAKRTALVMIPASLVAVVLHLWGWSWRLSISPRRLALASLAGVLLVVMLGIIILAWTRVAAAHTPAVPSGVDFLFHYYLFLPSTRFPFSPDQPYFSAEAMATYAFYAKLIFQSFWARFGWLNVTMVDTWYQALAAVTLVAVIGLTIAAYRAIRGHHRFDLWQRKTLLFFGTCLFFSLVLIVGREIRTNWNATSLAGWPQGRYLFPVVVPTAALYAVGWTSLVPRRYHKLWLWCWVLSLIGLDTVALLRYILPFYYYSG